LTAIKRLVLSFWAAWLSIVTATNVLDALRSHGVLPQSFVFASGNWRWINSVMDPLGVPQLLQTSLFAGAIAWQALAALLFWRALAAYRGRPLAEESETILACGVNLALWAAFQVLDEVFLAYQPEGTHRAIFISQITTLVLLYLPPSESRKSFDDPPYQPA